MREKLPDDGAKYKCSFELEGWRCPKFATEAYHVKDLKEIPERVVLNGSALCETHLQFFGV